MFTQRTRLTGDEQMCWPGEKAGKPDSCFATTVTLYGMLGDTVAYPNIKKKNLEIKHLQPKFSTAHT